MPNPLKRRKYKRLFYSKPVLILLLVAFVFVARGAWNIYEKERETRKNLALAEQELSELEERTHILEGDIQALETQKGIETEIRKKFGVAKEGEEVIVILERKGEEGETSLEEKGLWQRIKSFFGF